MKNEEILKTAIDKALSSGLKLSFVRMTGKIRGIDIVSNCSFLEQRGIIFSHDFAKAFWGKGEVCSTCGENHPLCEVSYYEPCWQHHLQTMVLEKEPLKYLEKFL